MAKPNKKNQRALADAQRTAVAKRREGARAQRERRNQRRVITIVASAVGVALLILVGGLLYDQVYVPSQPVARVGDQTLSRNSYVTERRKQIASDMYATLDLIVRFGSQFGDQFAQRVPQLNAEAEPRTLRAAAVDDTTVNGWIDRQLIERGAASLNIQASDGEIAQQMVTALNEVFPASTQSMTTTATTEPLTTTETLTATATAEPTAAPTLQPDSALQQEAGALQRMYDYYGTLVGGTRNVTVDEFRAALTDQYRRQVLTDKIEANLVDAETFTPSTDPTSIEIRHILVKVEVPEGATDAERAAAYAERKPEADAILSEVQGGADFATVAQEKSQDLTTAAEGGLLTSFDNKGQTSDGTQVDPAILAAAQQLTEPQQIANEVIQTPFGWHIIQLERRVVPTTEEQLQTARSTAFDTWLADQRAQATIERFPAQVPTSTPAPTVEGEQTPLPTAPLGGIPTVVSDTTSLTDTTTLTDTTSLETATPVATPTGTPAAATTAEATTAEATTEATSAATAVATPAATAGTSSTAPAAATAATQ